MESPQWSGDMLNQPEMVEAFATQLRKLLGSHADYIARIRRDAEAMWDANPPEGYSTFESWWRARWVKGPLADIQEHLEAAAKLTFKLEARYRRGRHEIPAARQAAKQPKAPELGPGAGRFGDRTRTAAGGSTRPPAPSPAEEAGEGGDFMDLVRQQGGRSA